MDDQNQALAQQSPPPIVSKSSSDGPSYGKKNWVKWFLIYAIIAVVVYGAIYFLFLSKQGTSPYSTYYTTTPQPTVAQDETASWEIYTNKEYTFSIRYPNGWAYEESDKPFFAPTAAPPYYKKYFSIVFHNPAIPQEFMTIGLITTSKNLTLSEAIDLYSLCIEVVPEKGKPYVVDDKEGKIFENTNCGAAGGITYIHFVNDAVVYSIISQYYNNLIDQILSTFTFLE